MLLKSVIEVNNVFYGKKFLRIICAPISTDDLSDDQTDNTQIIGYVFLVEDVTEAKVNERSRDEFFAVASHELRTPLTAIRGNTDMILDAYAEKIVDKDMKEMLADINTSSIRLIGIVNDFLEVSRLEQGKIELHKEKFNINEVVSKVVRDFKSIVDQKKIYLEVEYLSPESSLPKVFSDKSRIEQVLVNLVGNAVKFTKEGGIKIKVGWIENFVIIHIVDTGVGISIHNQVFLFRKFQQAGEQMLARDITQSTGLGLYICKLLISALGGTIDLEESNTNKGSTFTFTIPSTL
jgi:signal transduction histidine kinase